MEIGLAHGYFLIGPFVKLGPLRNSDMGLLAGLLSTIGLILILTLGLTIYTIAQYPPTPSTTPLSAEPELHTRAGWNDMKSGFFVGACGGAIFAYICLLSIPNFALN